MDGKKNAYTTLQVDRRAEPEVIEGAYKRLARKYHPDTNKSPEATRIMQEINGAWEMLKDPARRAEYDRELERSEAARASPRPTPNPTPTPTTQSARTGDTFRPAVQPVETIILASSYESKRAGGYSFYLSSPRLVVTEASGRQSHYDVRNLVANQWFALKNSMGELLQVYLRWDNITLQVRVGAPPPGQAAVLAVQDGSFEWRFEARMNSLYTHPEGGLRLRYVQIYPGVPGHLEVSTSLETMQFRIEDWPNRRWVELHHPRGGVIPLRVQKDGNRLTAEWLPLNAPVQPAAAANSTTTGAKSAPVPSKGDVARAVGGLALVGLTALAQWLASKSEDETD